MATVAHNHLYNNNNNSNNNNNNTNNINKIKSNNSNSNNNNNNNNNHSEPQNKLHWHKRLLEGGEEDVVLDENILDSHSLDMAAIDHNQRRQSFASNPSLVSPTQQTWPEFSYTAAEPPTNYPLAHQPGLFPEHGGNHFSQPDAPQYAHYANHVAQWQPQGTQGPEPTQNAFQTFPPDIDTIKPEAPYNSDVIPSQHPNVYGGLPVQMDSDFPPYAVSAASPQWSTSSSDNVEKIPRSGHFQSPMYNLNPPHLRRDGVRKKNARFDIPEGHNLQTIDNLINSTNPNDEDTIKTLKQQKRLLRNRQAALDSRCRKKHHTEKLEEEKKQYLAIIDRLEDEVQSFRLNEQRWMQERQQWHQYSEDLVRQKEELVRQHTLETADLRRKNTFLTEEAQRLESVSMSAQPSSTGVSAGFPEFEHLTMESSPFDDFSFIDNPILEAQNKQDTSLVVHPKRESPTPTNSVDKAATPGLLLMLLLCGAWVASKSTASAPAAIPRMPDDVRVASSAILENIYNDAGIQMHVVQPASIKNGAMTRAGACQPPINTAFPDSHLASLHHDLTRPTEQQQREQLFSLSVDQYNHITTDDCFEEDSKPTPQSRRRNLGEALAAMRAERKGPAAEVYTRSLMMNEVPADVVRDFARMMADANAVRHGGEPLS